MNMADKFLAIDMGASSGRVIAGILENGILTLEEMHRFENGPVEKGKNLYWDFDGIFREIKEGLRKALAKHPDAKSIGIDTWGVDYVILKKDGSFAREAYNYRDERTNGMPEEVFAKVPEEELYGRAGIQQMFFNTIYQLQAHKKEFPQDLEDGSTLLLVPDAIAYLLCGDTSCEYTEASTTNLLNATTRQWDFETIDKLGFPRSFFPALTAPGTVVGRLREDLAAELGCPQVEICKVGSHDTASAVAALPAPADKEWLYISCGTWALFGAELDQPVLTKQAMDGSFTNEGGVGNKIQFLTNIIGMWLAQELKADWAQRDGEKMPWSLIDKMAVESKGLEFIIDPNYPDFRTPGDMAGKIRRFCERTGQGTPTDAQTIRCVYDSLALCFRNKLEEMKKLSGTDFTCFNVVGGGSNAKVIMQIVADVCNVQVIAGPTEATAAGNILTQAMAYGAVKDLQDARDVVRNSFVPVIYEVKDSDRAKFDAAYAKYLTLI